MRPRMPRIARGVVLGLALTWTMTAAADAKDFKIGVIFDETGPFAGGGSKANLLGTKLAIDMINERGGVEGYTIVPTYADAQSKIDIALNEAERLINDVKVDMLMGVYSSAQCVPLSAKVDAAQEFWWATVCIASNVFKDKNLRYVFRPTVHSDQYGQASCLFLSENAKEKLGKDPKDLKVAILHEDGPYGVGVAQAADDTCKELGIQVVHKEGYAATSTDLSALVTKLRRARPDVLLHVGYNPDITLFLRQAKEAGLKFSALIGHGAGYSQYGKLEETFGKDVNLFMDVDPVAAQILDPSSLQPGLGELIHEMLRRWQAAGGTGVAPPHLSMGFNNTYVFLTDVLPRAIKVHGGIDAEALRKAALETDIAIGGTMQGYGVKFYPPGDRMAGQNARSIAVVMQYVDGKTNVVWPKQLRTAEPILPLPAGHAYAP
jgi:branched-chain amino acid transport system substrate-binding protein